MDNPRPNPAPAWLSDQAWSHLCGLDALDAVFNGLADSLQEEGGSGKDGEWRALYDAPAPHTHPLPGACVLCLMWWLGWLLRDRTCGHTLPTHQSRLAKAD